MQRRQRGEPNAPRPRESRQSWLLRSCAHSFPGEARAKAEAKERVGARASHVAKATDAEAKAVVAREAPRTHAKSCQSGRAPAAK